MLKADSHNKRTEIARRLILLVLNKLQSGEAYSPANDKNVLFYYNISVKYIPCLAKYLVQTPRFTCFVDVDKILLEGGRDEHI